MSPKARKELLRRREQRRKKMAARPSLEHLEIWPEKVEGGRLVQELQRFVGSLRDENAHGNRGLFLDDVFVVYLLAFFNPTLRTLRTIEDFSQTVQAQRHLTVRRICRSTLSDFHKLADPQRLQPILTALRSAVTRKFPASRQPADLTGLLKQIVAVDGTFFSAAADVAWAVGMRNQHTLRHRARVDVQLDVGTWLPEVIAIPEPSQSEPERAATTIQPGAIHVYDRNYGSFTLIAAHYEEGPDQQLVARAEFVLRAKENHLHFQSTETRALEDAQRAVGITSDQIGYLTGSKCREAPHVKLREIVIALPEGDTVRLLTNLLELPAEVIGTIYKSRWGIELFFRWLKCYAHFDHLISHSRQGLLLNFYVVIIGVLLMYLHTGGRPSKYALLLLAQVAQHGGSLESILPILRERERQCEVARQSAARRRAKKKAESR